MKTIHHVVDVDADADRVFAALTTEQGLAGWWSTVVSTPPAEVGTVVDFTFVGDFHPDMEVVEIDSPSLLVWRCVGGHEPWDDNTFRFELEAVDDGRTRLRFWQHYARELDDDAYGIYNFNWGYYLSSLHELCETGTGAPYRPDAA